MTPEQEIRQAQNAERLLSDPLIREFFDKLHTQIYKGIKNANVGFDERERLAALGRFADEFEAFFRHCIQSGQMAELRIKEDRTQQEKEAALMAAARSRVTW